MNNDTDAEELKNRPVQGSHSTGRDWTGMGQPRERTRGLDSVRLRFHGRVMYLCNKN